MTPETARTNALTFQVKSKERDYIDIDGSLSYVIKHLTTTDDEVIAHELIKQYNSSIATATDATQLVLLFRKPSRVPRILRSIRYGKHSETSYVIG